MKGKDLIKWIQINNLEEVDIYMHEYDPDKRKVVRMIKENVLINERGDILISAEESN